MLDTGKDPRARCIQSALREAEKLAQEFEWLDQEKFADYWQAEVMRLRRLLKEGQTHEPTF